MATNYRIKIQGTSIKEYTSKKVFEAEVATQLKRAIENADDLEIPCTLSIHKSKYVQKNVVEVAIAYVINK